MCTGSKNDRSLALGPAWGAMPAPEGVHLPPKWSSDLTRQHTAPPRKKEIKRQRQINVEEASCSTFHSGRLLLLAPACLEKLIVARWVCLNINPTSIEHRRDSTRLRCIAIEGSMRESSGQGTHTNGMSILIDSISITVPRHRKSRSTSSSNGQSTDSTFSEKSSPKSSEINRKRKLK